MAPLISELFTAVSILISNIPFLLIGVFVGMALGLLPGMGGSVALALLIPFTLDLAPEQAFILFGGALGATSFSGSVTAILLNTPGTASNAATLLDGYPMTRAGRAREAIGASAMASAAGAFVGLLIFLFTIPVLQQFSLLFGTPEIFWLSVTGIAVIPLVIRGSMLKGLLSGLIGLLFAFHGFDYITGQFRFDYILFFTDQQDIELVPVIIGLFAIAEMLRLGIDEESISSKEADPVEGDLWRGIKSVFESKLLFFQSSIIGFLAGVVPGIGGTMANLVSYGFANNLTKRSEEFGTGNIDGIIASEAANDSKDGGQLVPTFGLGIPGSASTAVLLSAFIIHGLRPGPQFIRSQVMIVLVTFLALLASNVLTSIIGILASSYLIYITKVDITILFPSVIAISMAAAYITRNSYGDMIFALIFGIIGFAFIKLGITRVPFIIAIVLGRIIEENFIRTLALADDPTYFISSPISLLLIAILAGILLYPVITYTRDRIRSGQA